MSNSKVTFKEILRRIIFILSLVVFIWSSYKIFITLNEYRNNKNTYKEVQEFAPEVVDNDEGEKSYSLTPEDYDKLLSINNDFKVWLTVPNTNINYPVVQTSDNAYYLTNNFKRESNPGGAIFISCDNVSPFEERNTIIHGHNMRDGSMFASLNKFKEEDFFNDNKYVYVNLRDKVLKYEVFSTYVEEANIESYKYSFGTDEDYVSFLNKIRNKSMHYRDGVELTKDDKIITLSTCTYEINDGRLLVQAKLVNE